MPELEHVPAACAAASEEGPARSLPFPGNDSQGYLAPQQREGPLYNVGKVEAAHPQPGTTHCHLVSDMWETCSWEPWGPNHDSASAREQVALLDQGIYDLHMGKPASHFQSPGRESFLEHKTPCCTHPSTRCCASSGKIFQNAFDEFKDEVHLSTTVARQHECTNGTNHGGLPVDAFRTTIPLMKLACLPCLGPKNPGQCHGKDPFTLRNL